MESLSQLKQQLTNLNQEYAKISSIPADQRKDFGLKLNQQKQAILNKIEALESAEKFPKLPALDITAPANLNQPLPTLKQGTKHPLMVELDNVIDIYAKMGFDIVESFQLDDEFHMFESLNFPPDHPARDSYDTFRTKEGFIPPAHTSTMQNRILTSHRQKLIDTGEIAAVIPGRVFRNEDLDATHEHTFYQCEGIYVSKTANLGQMLAVLKNFFETYYGQSLNIKTQPGYFPFTEPSLEFMIERPSSLGGSGYLEMLGCGMIHPNVLKHANIDPTIYKGFAWGGGIDRLVMLKYQLNDIRHFHSAKLDFMKEF